jgi:CRP/FNR family transcriptional regulator, cyclic AMP receptor protein
MRARSGQYHGAAVRGLGWVTVLGYLASLLVFCTFCMKTMIPLRGVAIASNVAFMAFALLGNVLPVFFLHALLLPLNVLRLREMRIMIRRVREAASGDLSMEWLVGQMTRQRHKAGDVLFRIGDPARAMYVILSGTVRVTEIGISLSPGTIVGEIGLFTPNTHRTGTAVCETDVEIGSISDQRVLQLYFQNPTFGLYLMRLAIRRMVENQQRWMPARS